MRRKSAVVTARQDAKADERTIAYNARLAELIAVAPGASHDDLRYLALHCGTLPTFPTILRVLASR